MSNSADEGIYTIKDQKDYLGGFVGTGIMAIVQTALPLLLYQLAKKPQIEGDSQNPWYIYAWQAMQANGVVSYGLQALGFFATFMFDLSVFERLGLIMLWFTHGGILALLGAMTTGIYFIVALAKAVETDVSHPKDIGINFAIYTVLQIGFAVLAKYTMWDTIMYLIAGELKEVCEKYGALCGEYNILEKREDADQGDVSNLSVWNW